MTSSANCDYHMHVYSGTVEPAHPLSEFCRRAVPLLDVAASVRIVYVDVVDKIHPLVKEGGVPCLLVHKSDQVAALVGVNLRLWVEAHIKNDSACQSEFRSLCDKFTRAEERMLKCSQSEIKLLDENCKA